MIVEDIYHLCNNPKENCLKINLVDTLGNIILHPNTNVIFVFISLTNSNKVLVSCEYVDV